ncbi:hypothetical protein [Priestia megaterium]|jgi:hypothetical protein|uniref:hypothetical protein n=1 Tax=Priestia megaterium TaxID=1404 RepID=UPI00211BCE60|nr:hypothetical protein [Priestia megaterium]
MARITNRMILDLFIQYFEGEKKFTPSENKMNGIKLSQLRKSVKKYIEDNNIETDLSVEQIIIDTIEYSAMIGMKFRSIASLGYSVLGDSINYWVKRREVEIMKQEESTILQNSNQNDEKIVAKDITSEYNKINNRERSPKWMNNNGW